MTNTKHNWPSGHTLTVRSHVMNILMEKYQWPKTRTMKAMNATSFQSLDGYLNRDIMPSIQNICRIVSYYGIEHLLEFFEFDGQPINVRLTPEIIAGTQPLEAAVSDGSDPTAAASPSAPAATPAANTTMMGFDFVQALDRINAMQAEAARHEREALERQRNDMQTIIDEKDLTIRSLERELRTLRAQLNPYPTAKMQDCMVADGSGVAYNNKEKH